MHFLLLSMNTVFCGLVLRSVILMFWKLTSYCIICANSGDPGLFHIFFGSWFFVCFPLLFLHELKDWILCLSIQYICCHGFCTILVLCLVPRGALVYWGEGGIVFLNQSSSERQTELNPHLPPPPGPLPIHRGNTTWASPAFLSSEIGEEEHISFFPRDLLHCCPSFLYFSLLIIYLFSVLFLFVFLYDPSRFSKVPPIPRPDHLSSSHHPSPYRNKISVLICWGQLDTSTL